MKALTGSLVAMETVQSLLGSGLNDLMTYPAIVDWWALFSEPAVIKIGPEISDGALKNVTPTDSR